MSRKKISSRNVEETRQRVSELFVKLINEIQKEMYYKHDLSAPPSFQVITHLIARNNKMKMIISDIVNLELNEISGLTK